MITNDKFNKNRHKLNKFTKCVMDHSLLQGRIWDMPPTQDRLESEMVNLRLSLTKCVDGEVNCHRDGGVGGDLWLQTVREGREFFELCQVLETEIDHVGFGRNLSLHVEVLVLKF